MRHATCKIAKVFLVRSHILSAPLGGDAELCHRPPALHWWESADFRVWRHFGLLSQWLDCFTNSKLQINSATLHHLPFSFSFWGSLWVNLIKLEILYEHDIYKIHNNLFHPSASELSNLSSVMLLQYIIWAPVLQCFCILCACFFFYYRLLKVLL